MKWCLEVVQPLYLVEAHDIDDPGAESCSRRGFLPHKLGVELRVAQVFLLHTPYCSLRNVLFVKVHQSLQEVVNLRVHAHVHGMNQVQKKAKQKPKTSWLGFIGEVLFAFCFFVGLFPGH